MNLRKFFFLFALIIGLSNSFMAADLYWVGNGGNWNDITHWSYTSGGTGGASIPSLNDNIYFDRNSFSSPNQTVVLPQTISINDLSIGFYVTSFELKSFSSSTIEIYGEADIDGTFKNELLGEIRLLSTSTVDKNLNFGRWNWKTNFTFEGNGKYILNNPLLTPNNTIELVKGELDLNFNDLICSNFVSNSGVRRKLRSEDSDILVYNSLTTDPHRFNHNLNDARIFVLNSALSAVDKGSENYEVTQNQIYKTPQNKVITGIVIEDDTVTCGNNCNGRLFIDTVFTDCPPYTVSEWIGVPSSAGLDTVENLCPGSYTALMEDDCGFLSGQAANILGHPPIVPISETVDQISCKDVCDGRITVTVIGATYANMVFTWTPMTGTLTSFGNTTIYSGLCEGSYSLNVVDGFGCDTTFNYSIVQPDSLHANVTVTDPVCFGDCTGSITSNPSGGTPPFTYAWTPATGNPNLDTAQTFNNLCVGNTYEVTVTDKNGCINDTTIQLVTPPQFIVDTSFSNVSCGGECDATISLEVTIGGVPPYNHSWSNGHTNTGTTSTLNNLCFGSYSDTITDNLGCDTVITFVITEPTELTTSTVIKNITCVGDCNGSAVTFPSGGAGDNTFTWSCGPSTFDSIVGLCPVSPCIVTVMDKNGCTVLDTFNITEPLPLLVNPGFNNISCPGLCDGTASASPSGGTGNPGVDFSYTWTGPGGPYFTQAITGLCPGTYVCSIIDSAGCTAIDSVTVVETTPLNLSMASSNETCFNTCDGGAGVNVTGGTQPYSYVWTSVPGGQVSSGQGTDSIFDLCVGTYTVTVTDSLNCSDNSSVILSPQTVILPNLTAFNASCNGICDGGATVTPTGGVGPYTVSWNGGANISIPIGGSNTISTLCGSTSPGTLHNAVVKDMNGCSISIDFNVVEPPAITTTSNKTDVTCFGFCDGTAVTTPVGGTGTLVASWDSIPTGGSFPIIGNSVNNLCTGTYYVTITDDSLCSITDTVIISPAAQVFPNVSFTNITCNGLSDGSAISQPSGGTPGYTFSWTGPPPAPATTAALNNLSMGQYIVTVTDTNGCAGIDTVNIGNPSSLSVNASANSNADCGSICNGTASAVGSGGTPGYTFSWNSVPPQTGSSASNLCAGTYTVTITDSNGCTATDTTVINNITVITLTPSVVGISCNGVCDGTATMVPSGGASPYEYAWNNGDTSQTADSLCLGMAYITVTDDNGCSVNDSVDVPTGPAALSANGSIDQTISCNGLCDARVSSAPTGGTPPYTSFWTLPGGGNDTNNVCPTIAIITVTDTNNCTDADTLTIIEPTIISPNSVVVDVACNGDSTGSITLNPTGGTGGTYTYTWLPNVSSGSSATNLPAGVYQITVQDSNGCQITVSDTVNEPSPLSTSPIGVDVSCNAACDGIASVSVSGGVTPYSYSWSLGGQTNDSIFNLCAPNLTNTVTVTDSNGCVISQVVTINEPAVLNANVSGSPINCGSVCSGSAFSNPTGGTTPYSYVWSSNALPNPLNGSSIVNLCEDTFTVLVTDSNGCTASGSYIVTQPTPLILTLDSTNVVCNGANNGTASVNITSGTQPYSFSWVGGCLPGPETTSSISGLCPGIYTVNVSDSNNCVFVGSVNITEPDPIDDNEVVIDANCGVCDGFISVSPSGGNGGYNHSWSNGVTFSNNSNLCAGFYTDTITDSQGCVALFTIAVSNPSGPSGVSTNVNDVKCYQTCDGSLSAIPIGGTPPYSYSWTSVPVGGPYPNDSALTGLCAGMYNLTLTDSIGCILTTSLTVDEADSISVLSASTNPSCSGVCDGTASVTASGGMPPYNYSWSHNGTNSPTVSGLCVGPVSVTITDFFGCSKVVNFNITSPDELTLTSNSTNLLCNGTCDGSATVNPTGGTGPYNYTWDDLTMQTTQTASGLCPGTYTVLVTDSSGCSGSDTVLIATPSPIVANATSTPSSCGNNDGTADVSGSSGGTGAHSYSWPSLGLTIPNPTGLAAGSYTVIISDINLCSQSFLVAITDTGGSTVAVSSSNASCNGVCDGIASATVTTGTPNYQYLWSPDNQTTSSVSGLCAGNYTVQVTDGAGCITVESVTIDENSPIDVTLNTTPATCAGNCNGSAIITPNGGVPPYQYSWDTGDTLNALSGLCAGNYSVTITDNVGCFVIQNVSITEPDPVNVNVSGIAANCSGSCNGQASSVVSGGTGTYTYTWSNGGSTPNISGLCAGNYSLTVNDISGCSDNADIVIGDGNPITATINDNPATCGVCDGSVTVIAGGGVGSPYTYDWSPGSETTPTISNLCPGAYSVSIEDNTGCERTFNVLISNLNGPTLSTESDTVSCFGSCDGMTWTTVTAGNPNYNYQWDDPSLQANDTASNLCGGLYTVVVQDGAGCVTVDSVSVIEPQEISLNITSTNPNCDGICDGTATVTPSGGVPPYTVSWNGGAPTPVNGSNTINGLCIGTHTALITDSTGCSIVDSVTLTSPSPISITLSSTPITCLGDCDGTANAVVSGGSLGYTYSWNTIPTQTNNLATGLCAGTYTITVTDSNNCVKVDSIQLSDPPLLSTSSTPTSTSCTGFCDGAITTNPSGGIGSYSYIWSNGGSSQTITNLCTDTFDVIVLDGNNCTTHDTIILIEPSTLNDNTVVTDPTCGICNGSATSTPTGGVGPYNFVWTDLSGNNPSLPFTTNGQPSSTVVGLCGGSVRVQITDVGTGCTSDHDIIINSVNGPNLSVSSTDETCANACNGTASATASGGNPPYAYSWAMGGPPIGTNQNINNLCIGSYTITVTDSINCVSSDTVTILSSSMSLAMSNVIPETCFGDCDGSATVTVTDGASPFIYSWSPGGQSSATATGLCASNYVVTVTDSTNCVDSISTTIITPNAISLSTSITNTISCHGMSDGSITASASGGTSNFTYSWNTLPVQTTPTASGLSAGTYVVTVMDDNSCIATDTIILEEPDEILANESLTPPSCGQCDGSIAVVPSGGIGPYTFLWTTPSSPPSPQPVTATIINLCAGAYSLEITDSTGCTANFSYPLSNSNAPDPNTSVTHIGCNGECNGSIVSNPIGGTPPYTYSWNPSGNTNSISNLCSGSYSLNVIDSLGCVGVAIDSIVEPELLQTTTASANMSCNGICDGWVVANPFGGTLPYSYNWTPGNLTQDSITALCGGTYLVTITDSNGCTVTDSATVVEPGPITSTMTKTDATCPTACDGIATVSVMGGNPNYLYEWNGSGTPGLPTDTGLCIGLNTVVISDQNGCSISDSVTIIPLDTIIATVGNDTVICLGESVTLKGVPEGDFTSVQWFELPGLIPLGTTDSIQITPITSGETCFAYQVNGVCSDIDTVCVTVDSLPLADGGPDDLIFINNSTTLGASGGVTYSWTPSLGLSDTTVANPIASPKITTTYAVTVSSANGCSAIDSVTVTVVPNIIYPDGISPNGDGKNEVWVIDFIEEFPNNVVEIYNRWGELMFHAKGYKQDWNGTYQGKPLPIGTYYFVIDLNKEPFEPITGPITILR